MQTRQDHETENPILLPFQESCGGIQHCDSGSSAPLSSVFSKSASAADTDATPPTADDDDLITIQNLRVRKDAGLEAGHRQAFEDTFLPSIQQELGQHAYARTYSIELCSVGVDRSKLKPAILICTTERPMKKRIFVHLTSLPELRLELRKQGLDIHVVFDDLQLAKGPHVVANELESTLAYLILPLDGASICRSKLVIQGTPPEATAVCTAGLTFLVGDRLLSKTALHPWTDVGTAETGEINDAPDEDDDDGLALSFLAKEGGDEVALTVDSHATWVTPSIAELLRISRRRAHSSPYEAELINAHYQRTLRALIMPVHYGEVFDWVFCDPIEAAPDSALEVLAKNEVNGHLITRFQLEDPRTAISVTVATHEGEVSGSLHPGKVMLQSAHWRHDLRLVTLEQPLRPGCSGASVTHRDELCGTIVAVKVGTPWAYMTPIHLELGEMSAVCRSSIRLPAAGEVVSKNPAILAPNLQKIVRSREEVDKRLERIHAAFKQYDFKIDEIGYDILVARMVRERLQQGERLHEHIRMRVKYTCHNCKTAYGRDRVCMSCQRTRCSDCVRYPAKKTKQVKAEPDVTAAKPSTLADYWLHRGVCHECRALYQLGDEECRSCCHRICVQCLTESKIFPSTTATESKHERSQEVSVTNKPLPCESMAEPVLAELHGQQEHETLLMDPMTDTMPANPFGQQEHKSSHMVPMADTMPVVPSG